MIQTEALHPVDFKVFIFYRIYKELLFFPQKNVILIKTTTSLQVYLYKKINYNSYFILVENIELSDKKHNFTDINRICQLQ